MHNVIQYKSDTLLVVVDETIWRDAVQNNMPSNSFMYSRSKENIGTVEKKSFQRRLQQKRPVDERRVGVEDLDNQKCFERIPSRNSRKYRGKCEKIR